MKSTVIRFLVVNALLLGTKPFVCASVLLFLLMILIWRLRLEATLLYMLSLLAIASSFTASKSLIVFGKLTKSFFLTSWRRFDFFKSLSNCFSIFSVFTLQSRSSRILLSIFRFYYLFLFLSRLFTRIYPILFTIYSFK